MGGFFLRLKELFSQKWRRCGRGALAAAMLLALCGAGAWGETYNWNGGASGDWDNATDWNPNGVPGASDIVNIPYSANPLTFTKTINVASLLIDAQNSVEFTGTVNVGTLYVHANSSLNFAAGLTVTNFYVYANYGVSTVPITISGGSASIDNYSYNLNGQGSLSDESVVTVDSGATLNIGSGTIPNLVNNGTVNATGSVTVNDYSGSGSKTGSLTILSGGTTDTYYWIGEGAANTWNDGNNWSDTDGGSAIGSYPQTGDTAIFNTTVAQSFSENITVDKIEIASGAEIEFSGTVTVGEIENNGKITSSNSLTLSGYSGSGEIENSGTLKINSASGVTIPSITNSDTVENIGAGALTITTLTMAGDTAITNSGAGGIIIGELSGNYNANIDTGGKRCDVNGYNGIDIPSIECNGNNMYLSGGKISSLKVNTSIVVLKEDLNVVNDVDLVVSGGSLVFGEGNSLTVGGNLTIDGSIGGYAGHELGSLVVNGNTEIKPRNKWDNLVVTGDVVLGDGVGNGEFNNAGIVKVGGNITINGTATNSGTMEISAGKTLTLGSNFTNTGTLTTNSTSKIIANGNASQTINFGTTINVESFTYSPTAPAQTLTITTPASPQSSLGNFTATTNTGNATIIINGNNTFNNFTTDIVASITMGDANTFNGNFTASGNTNITLSGANTFNGNFTFTGDTDHGGAAQVTLNAANSFTNFTFSKGNSLTVNAVQTVSGNLLLSGKSSSNKLYVTGTNGSFAISADQTAQLLRIDRNNVQVTGYVVTAEYSEDSTSDPTELKNGWKISSNGVVTWTGSVDGSWENENNWEPKIVPGKSGNDYEVLIPAEYPVGTEITNFPKTADTYTITKTVTIASNASLEIDSTVTLSAIVNNGELVISADFTMPATYSGGGEVKITDQALLDVSAGGTIEKLTIGNNTILDSMAATGVPSIKLGASNVNISGTLANYGKIIFTGAGRVDKNDVANKGTVQYSGGSNFTDFGATDYYNLIVDSGVSVKGKEDCVIEGNFELKGQVELYEGITPKKITVKGETTIAVGARFSCTGDQTYNGNVTNNGTLDLGEIVLLFSYADVTFGANFINNGTFTEENSTLTATGADATIGGSSAFTIKEFKYIPTTPNNAKLTIDGANTINTFASESAGVKSITIKGANNFQKFTVKNSGTLTVNAAQTVSGTLSISGTDESNPLTVDGTGQFNLASEQKAKYLVVGTNVKICDSTGTDLASGTYLCKALRSKFSDDTTGIKNGWCVVGDTITWTGADATNPTAWSEPNNWDVKIVPGVYNANPDDDATVYKVVIPVKYNSVNIEKYPVAAAAYTVKDLTIGGDQAISDSTATSVPSVTLEADNIVLTETPVLPATSVLANYGKIIYSGAGRITNNAASPVPLNDVDSNHKGTVQYKGNATTLNDFASGEGDDYYNLIIDADLANASANIIVAGKTKFNASAVTAKSLTFKGDVESTVTLTINGSVFVIGNGNAVDCSDLTISDDFILLGKDYKIADDGANQSGVSDLFAYNHSARDGSTHAVASCTDYFPSDATIIGGNGSLSIATGTKISVGKNFYANGIKINSGGVWTLKIPDNDFQTVAFAELYNSTIENCTVTTSGTKAYVAAAENNNVTNCNGVEQKRPLIKEVYTVYDDVIFISFGYDDGAGNVEGEALIENSNNEIWNAVANINHWNGAAKEFVGAYTDADCTTKTTGHGDISSFYIKAKDENKWNTNATGCSAGNDSTDRSGTHRTAIPCINIKKALGGVYETLRDNHKNRIAQYHSDTPNFSSYSSVVGKTFTAVTDHCAPVIIGVYTGQEMHVANAAQQRDCDSHNFIEFLYSEEINIDESAIQVLPGDVNKQAVTDLGATISAEHGFRVAGFGTFANGKLEVGLKPGSEGVSPNALYRKFSAAAESEVQENKRRVRLSVAGYVDGTVLSTSHKNWAGYISAGEMPTGNSFSCEASLYVKDVSANGNSADDGAATENHRLALININAQPDKTNLHGAWDVTPPSFAPMRVNKKDSWMRPTTDANSFYEIIGVSYTGGMLNAIELHIFDNEPTYEADEPLQWFSRVGWATPKPSAGAEPSIEYESIVSKAADVLGGSRPYPAIPATGGGVRYCSVYNANNSFTYADSNDNYAAYHGFSKNIGQGALSAFFTDIDGSGSDADEKDGHYLKLFLDDTMLSSETNFILKFDSSTCYVTDLAGNRIQCGTISMKSVDRTPPSFLISAAPLGMDKLLIIFSKELKTDEILLYHSAKEKTAVNALEYIPRSIELTNESGTGIQVDTSVPAQVVFQSKRATGIAVKLKQNTVLKDITSGVRITIKSDADSYDPLSGTVGKITYIQDEWGNFIQNGLQHAYSDFAVNAVQMQYAYSIIDPSMEEADKLDLNQVNFAVRNWDAEQGRNGFVIEEKEIILHAALYDGTEDNSGGLDTNAIPTAYFDSSPTPQAVSDIVNTLMQEKRKWRIWIPNVESGIFDNIASMNNEPEFHVDGELANSSKSTDRQFVNFDIPQDVSTNLWKSGDQVSFIFKLGDYKVDHNADGVLYPLYCLRLSDSADLASLDLWSFTMKNTVQQRGGVSIRNNVINVNEGQKTTLQVEVRTEGNLNVVVTSLDGSIIKYLHHGRAQKGTHYYTWDGTNNGGTPVARGLYFVRVSGAGIDETRKVMCVK